VKSMQIGACSIARPQNDSKRGDRNRDPADSGDGSIDVSELC
jgi:hypothetical protein